MHFYLFLGHMPHDPTPFLSFCTTAFAEGPWFRVSGDSSKQTLGSASYFTQTKQTLLSIHLHVSRVILVLSSYHSRIILVSRHENGKSIIW